VNKLSIEFFARAIAINASRNEHPFPVFALLPASAAVDACDKGPLARFDYEFPALL
jgi:hypothetical protein